MPLASFLSVDLQCQVGAILDEQRLHCYKAELLESTDPWMMMVMITAP